MAKLTFKSIISSQINDISLRFIREHMSNDAHIVGSSVYFPDHLHSSDSIGAICKVTVIHAGVIVREYRVQICASDIGIDIVSVSDENHNLVWYYNDDTAKKLGIKDEFVA